MISLLYVDDDQALLDVFKLSMEENGEFSVDIFASGHEALDHLINVRYDAIIVDYLLADMDALLFLKVLRSRGDDTPFILFTGKGREEVAIDAFEGGADFYIQKGKDPTSQFNQISLKVNLAIDRRRSEKLLRESEERFRSFFEQSSVGCAINSPDGSWIYVNRKFSEMSGYEESELLTMNWKDLIPPEIRSEELQSFFGEIKKKSKGFERALQFIRSDNSRYDVLVSTIPLKGSDGSILSYSSIIHDITKQKQAEEAIFHRERLLAAIAECTSILLKARDPNKGIADIIQIIGSAAKQNLVILCEVQSSSTSGEFQIIMQNIWVKDEANKFSAIGDVSGNGITLKNSLILQNLLNGDIVSEILLDSLIFDGFHTKGLDHLPMLLVPISVDKTFWGFLGFENETQDFVWKEWEKEAFITVASAIGSAKSRARIENSIREKNDYLESLITHANGPIIVWDPNLLITRINRACEILIGMSAHEVVGKHLSIIVPPHDRDRLLRLIQTTVSGVRWETVEIPVIHRDGSIRAVIWNSSTIFGPDAETPLATIAQGQDITETRRLEEEKKRMVRQIQENFAQQAILNDGIRNPLDSDSGSC